MNAIKGHYAIKKPPEKEAYIFLDFKINVWACRS